VTDVPYVPRSLGRETTYQRDLDDWDEVRAEVARLARQVAGEAARPIARVVVKVRFVPFVTRTHGLALTEEVTVEQAALVALDRFTTRRPVRLLGVRAEFAPDR
jgi:DNA polymerase-4